MDLYFSIAHHWAQNSKPYCFGRLTRGWLHWKDTFQSLAHAKPHLVRIYHTLELACVLLWSWWFQEQYILEFRITCTSALHRLRIQQVRSQWWLVSSHPSPSTLCSVALCPDELSRSITGGLELLTGNTWSAVWQFWTVFLFFCRYFTTNCLHAEPL